MADRESGEPSQFCNAQANAAHSDALVFTKLGPVSLPRATLGYVQRQTISGFAGTLTKTKVSP